MYINHVTIRVILTCVPLSLVLMVADSVNGKLGSQSFFPATHTQNNSNVPVCDCRRDCPRDPKCKCCPDVAYAKPDLTGEYAGKINAPEVGLTGDAVLKVDGERFQLTTESGTKSGRITAVKTGNYISAALSFDQEPGEDSESKVISVRVRSGDEGLVLQPVRNEKKVLTFREEPGREAHATPSASRPQQN